MPKSLAPMSPAGLQVIIKKGEDGRFWVGGEAGLMLVISENGQRRHWIARLRVGNRRRDIGVGSFKDVSLAEAREQVRLMRKQIRDGIDPIEAKREKRAALSRRVVKPMTFKEAAKATYLAQMSDHDAKTQKGWETRMRLYCYPVIGDMPVADITVSDIVALLNRNNLWRDKRETGTRVRMGLERVFAWSAVSGARTAANPAVWKGLLDAAMQVKRERVKHHRALPWKEMPDFMVALAKQEGMAAKALGFQILTAVRPGEARLALWSEIDTDAREWRIPGERMKGGLPHVVPLSDEALALLKSVPRLENRDTIFWAPRGGKLSDMAVSQLTRRMGVDAVPHGFRSAFKDWSSEDTKFANEVSEKALAHAIPSAVEAAYRRGDLLKKRVQLMAAWGRYLRK